MGTQRVMLSVALCGQELGSERFGVRKAKICGKSLLREDGGDSQLYGEVPRAVYFYVHLNSGSRTSSLTARPRA